MWLLPCSIQAGRTREGKKAIIEWLGRIGTGSCMVQDMPTAAGRLEEHRQRSIVWRGFETEVLLDIAVHRDRPGPLIPTYRLLFGWIGLLIWPRIVDLLLGS